MINNIPLATYFRPQNLKEFVGQKQAIASSSWLYQAIKQDSVPSIIFWGPPGSGKTTLAFIIAKETKSEFIEFSASSNGLKDLKAVVSRAQELQRLGNRTILFIDEIHRWNRAQQDALLPQIENGTIVLIGATTENPSFSVNSALLSRSTLVTLDALTNSDLKRIINRVEKELKIDLKAETRDLIIKFANGDARKSLNILESALDVVANQKEKQISPQLIKNIINKPNLLYDKKGEEHYNLISALHKSMRGGDANAAVYYLARMIEAGEDPLYIARRLIRFASEDVGLANNSALMLINSVYDACQKTGLPECSVNLAQAVIYLSKSPKSIQAYSAYEKARKEVENSGNLAVPLHLRNAPTKLMKNLGYGKNYKYPPLENDSKQEYLPDKLKGY